jgi:hypothetical protein
VQIYVAEWIPFGANQIVSLNERLGSLDRCQGGLFTSMVDKNPTDTQFQVAAGLTQVRTGGVETDIRLHFDAFCRGAGANYRFRSREIHQLRSGD